MSAILHITAESQAYVSFLSRVYMCRSSKQKSWAGVTSSSCSTYIHTLFSIENENMNVPDEVSDAALEAAVDFVSVSCQQTA